MLLTFKKIIFLLTFNTSLFMLLIIGIQNSSKKARANLIFNETIIFPISFIVGASFISGSITGSLIFFDELNKTSKSS